MIIEWHTHVYPPEEAGDQPTWDGKSGPGWGGRCPMTVENVLDAHHRAGIDISVVSNAAHYMRGKAETDELAAIRRWSDYAAEIQSRYPGTLYGLATILPCGGPAYIKEAERAIRELGLKGLFIHSSHKGHYPDDDEARPFWELVQDLDVPVMIHPPHVGFGEERMKEYRLASSIGRPADLCLALSRLIVRGILEDFPRVKIVSSHGGGGLCEVIGRMDYAYELQDEAYFLGPYAPMRIKHAPSHYLKKMYFDTVTYHAPAARLVLDTVGADHVLYGSDAPPLTSLKPRAIKLIEDLNLPPAERDAVFWRNAAQAAQASCRRHGEGRMTAASARRVRKAKRAHRNVGTTLRAFAHPTCAAVLVSLSLVAASAQDYPTRPIRAITATSAGGTSDIFMRLIGDQILKRWGQPIIVENRPGGSMMIGGHACASAPNDGYTICILPVETLAYNQFLFKKVPYDPQKDFEPITNPFFNTQVLVASTALNVNTLAELATLSKHKPGTLSYTVPSVALALVMDKWKTATGADLVRVPFRGGAEAVNGVLTGASPVAFFGLANWIPLLRSGAVRALAIDSAQRSPLLPDVPTLAELGYGQNLTRVYFGIVAPAGTPKPIVRKLRDEIARIGAEPEFRQKRLIEMGLEPVFDTPEDFAKFLIADRATSERVVKESGLQPQ